MRVEQVKYSYDRSIIWVHCIYLECHSYPLELFVQIIPELVLPSVRLVLSGCVDERMLQRQVMKHGISAQVVDACSHAHAHFSREELRALFTLHTRTPCLTHDLMCCPCGGDGSHQAGEEGHEEEQRACQLKQGAPTGSSSSMDQLKAWQHLAAPLAEGAVRDACLEAAQDFISYVFAHT